MTTVTVGTFKTGPGNYRYKAPAPVVHAWVSSQRTACGKTGTRFTSGPKNVDPEYWVTCKACRKAMGW